MAQELNDGAQEWADTLAQMDDFFHSQGSGLGENLAQFWGSPNNEAEWVKQKLAQSVQDWYDEIENYDMATGDSLSGMVRHFTQVVWDESTNLGIGWAVNNCQDWDGCRRLVVVARYQIAGNMQGTYTQHVHPLCGDACQQVCDCDDNEQTTGAPTEAPTDAPTDSPTDIPTTPADPCADQQCQNGNDCVFYDDFGALCYCDYPWSGQYCEYNADPCNYNNDGEPEQYSCGEGECQFAYRQDENGHYYIVPECIATTQPETDAPTTSYYQEPTSVDTPTPDLCENYGCSHVCYINSNGSPECACPAGKVLQNDLMTCEDYDNESQNEISSQFINPDDNTWRPILGFPTKCVTKKYTKYSVGQPYALMECDPSKRKTKFAYNADSGLLHHQSDKEEWNNFCVRAEDGNNSRLRVADCNENDPSQVWDYDSNNGHIYLRNDRKRCIVVGSIGASDDAWMKISNRCATNTWGRFA